MKRFFNNIYEFFFFLVRPSFWLMNHPYCEQVDTQLKIDLNKGVLYSDGYCAKIGDTLYWVGNYPYAYGSPYLFVEVRPSRMTIYKTRKAQLEFLFKPKTKLELVK